MYKNRKAFTMLELVFVIVVIGILSAIAIPKFAVTRDHAVITKAKNTVAAVRNAIVTERQKRILRGYFNAFTSLGGTTGNDKVLFDYFDGNATAGARILEYGPRSCKSGTSTGCWTKTNDTTYVFKMPLTESDITFKFDLKSRFDCDADANIRECRLLTQ